MLGRVVRGHPVPRSSPSRGAETCAPGSVLSRADELRGALRELGIVLRGRPGQDTEVVPGAMHSGPSARARLHHDRAFIWGEKESETVHVSAPEQTALERLTNPSEPPTLRDVKVFLGRTTGGSTRCFHLKASIRTGQRSLFSVCASRRPEPGELARFREGLQQGEARTLSYRTEWSGLSSTWALVAFAMFIVWAASGRTRVRFDPETGRVDAASQQFFFGAWQMQSFARDDIVEVLVSGSEAGTTRPVYRPAFHLTTGEIVPLGMRGHSSAQRARHWAGQLERLLATGQ